MRRARFAVIKSTLSAVGGMWIFDNPKRAFVENGGVSIASCSGIVNGVRAYRTLVSKQHVNDAELKASDYYISRRTPAAITGEIHCVRPRYSVRN